MALVEVGSPRKKPKNESTKDVIITTGTGSAPNKFTNVNSFSQFYFKRIIVQDSNGGGSPTTRIEEAAFACQPNQQPTYHFRGQSYEKLLQPDGVKERHHHKKSSHSSKDGTNLKSSLRKHSSGHSRHGKETQALYSIMAASLMLVCLLFGWWVLKRRWCQPQSLDFLSVESSLKNTVIGQEDTLNSLLLNFYRISNLNSQPPVFIFSGSTGVGKTFVVDHVVDNFPGAGHKELLFYPTPAPEAVVTRLATCEHNLLVLDGLYFKDSPEIASWTERIQTEAAAYNKPLWIILVFTTEHWTSETVDTPREDFLREISKISNKILEVFTSQEIDAKLITFKPMDVGSVKECARRELENLNLLADESQLDQIVQQLTSTPALRQKGCKHVKKYFFHSNNISAFRKAGN